MLYRILIVVAAIAAMVLGIWVASSLRSTDTESISQVKGFQGSVLSAARKITVPAALRKDDGSEFTTMDLQNHWTLIFFGYTHCPDVCPTTLNMLALAKKNIKQGFPNVIFISVDPERDTVDKLGEYVRYFDPDFTAVTGAPDMIEALTAQMSVLFMRVPGASNDENYLVDHSSSIMLINPKGELQAFLAAPHTSQSILDSLKQLIDNS